MIRELSVGILVLISGCGSDENDRFRQPEQCDPSSERVGTYLLRYTERSGTCGPVTDTLVHFSSNRSPTPDPSASCEYLSEPVWSEAQCTLETSSLCLLPADDQEIGTKGITTQMSEDGSRIEGTLDVTLRRASTRDFVCQSLYSVTYERQ